MGLSEKHYYYWQEQLRLRRSFKYVWAFIGIYSVFWFVILYGYFAFFPTGRTMALVSVVAFVVARLVVSNILYIFYKKQRPYQRYRFEPVALSRLFSVKERLTNSFPSKHVAGMAALSAVIYLFFPVWGIASLIIALLTGYGRVVLGYHFPSDVLAGFVVGMVSAFVSYYYLAPLLFTY